MCVSLLCPNKVALTWGASTHCPGIPAGPVDVVGLGCWTASSGYRPAAMEASWTVGRSERSRSEAAAFCVVHGSSETKPGKYYRQCELAVVIILKTLQIKRKTCCYQSRPSIKNWILWRWKLFFSLSERLSQAACVIFPVSYCFIWTVSKSLRR